MENYPERDWTEEHIKRMRDSGLKEVNCPAPDCGGKVTITKDTDVKEGIYKKRGDYFLDFKCNKCSRRLFNLSLDIFK